MESASEDFGSAEEDTCFGRGVDLADGLEDHVPVGTTEVGGCPETSDGVLFGVGVVDHDVRCVIVLDLGGEVLRMGVSLIIIPWKV